MQLNEFTTQLNSTTEELQLLRSQKNNITGDTARIRQEILQAVGATEEEIPFVGELIKVRTEASVWEPVIEQLLHSFALRLIVPEAYYQQVNQYVRQHDLRGRIVYQRFAPKEVAPVIMQPNDEQTLWHKLDFKKSPYRDWLESEISTRYDYLCVENLESFRLAIKAVTREGLMKNGNRHEKDDRPKVKNNRSR